ncbi:MAG: class I SAM-dependent methyltransferase [Scrofimicrobium sp.]
MERCKSVVDLGCGTGLYGGALTRSGVEVVGVDSSQSMLNIALKQERISRGLRVEATDTGLDDSSFDGVLCANVLHLHPEPEQLISEASRLVREGGLVAWITPTQALDQVGAVDGDIRSGRGWWGVFVALFVRTMTTPLALIAGVRVRPAEQVLDVLVRASENSLERIETKTFFGTQTLVLMRKVDLSAGGESLAK